MSSKMSKRIARFAAVQVMYQADIAGTEYDKTACNFMDDYAKNEKEYKKMDVAFFRTLVEKFSESTNLDDVIAKNLTDGKSIDLMPSIVKSIIKTGITELIFGETATPVIINDYVEIAKNFVDEKGTKLVNAILDRVSKCVERRAV